MHSSADCTRGLTPPQWGDALAVAFTWKQPMLSKNLRNKPNPAPQVTR